jgi:hypothetical protein
LIAVETLRHAFLIATAIILPAASQPQEHTSAAPSHCQCLAYFVYNFVVTLVLEPVQQQCFNAALDKLRADPRITVRLGSSITGEGGGGHHAGAAW